MFTLHFITKCFIFIVTITIVFVALLYEQQHIYNVCFVINLCFPERRTESGFHCIVERTVDCAFDT